jgi:hypothetical protein
MKKAIIVLLCTFCFSSSAFALAIFDQKQTYNYYGVIDWGQVGWANYTTFPTFDPDALEHGELIPYDLSGMYISGQIFIEPSDIFGKYWITASDVITNPDGWLAPPEYGVFSKDIVVDPINPSGFYPDHLVYPGQMGINLSVNFTGQPNYLEIGCDGFWFKTSNIHFDWVNTNPIPEPSTMAMLFIGLSGFAIKVRNRRKGTQV